jgi:hypothetical protein
MGRDSSAPKRPKSEPDPEWLSELTPEEREHLADPSPADVDHQAVLRWLETGEGDPWRDDK